MERASDEYVRSRTVLILETVGNRIGICSGSMVRGKSGKNYILTAAHCGYYKDQRDSFDIISTAGVRLRVSKIIAVDKEHDLMLLEGVIHSPLTLSNHISTHEHARVFGNGAGQIGKKSEGETLMTSKISPLSSLCNFLPMQTNVTSIEVVPGDSGGPVVNERGEIIGIASAYADYGRFSCIVRRIDIQKFMSDK